MTVRTDTSVTEGQKESDDPPKQGLRSPRHPDIRNTVGYPA